MPLRALRSRLTAPPSTASFCWSEFFITYVWARFSRSTWTAQPSLLPFRLLACQAPYVQTRLIIVAGPRSLLAPWLALASPLLPASCTLLLSLPLVSAWPGPRRPCAPEHSLRINWSQMEDRSYDQSKSCWWSHWRSHGPTMLSNAQIGKTSVRIYSLHSLSKILTFTSGLYQESN